ncbi:MAG: prolipoprotein diacylglyceryl transferase family protein [Myxococcota bacterium]
MHPTLLELPTPWGILPLHSYSVTLFLAILMSWYFVLHFGSEEEGLPRGWMVDAFWASVLAGLIGGHLLFALEHASEFRSLDHWLELDRGGILGFGSLLTGTLSSFLYCRRHRVDFGTWADVAAPMVGACVLFIRVGCYLYGCDFGRPLPEQAPQWLAELGRFPAWPPSGDDTIAPFRTNGSPVFAHHVTHYGLASDASHSLSVHPVQLYEAALGGFLFLIGMILQQYRQYRGQAFLIVLMLYAFFRIGFDSIRAEHAQAITIFSITLSQGLAALSVIACLIIHVRVVRHPSAH